jgi:fibronectin type 3 domain-containing protein
MRRTILALCTVAVGACVSLDKPEEVAECATHGTCINNPKTKDAAPPPDGLLPDRQPPIDGNPTIIEGYPRDAAADGTKPPLVDPDSGALLDGAQGPEPDAPSVAADGEPARPDSATDSARDTPFVTADTADAIGRDSTSRDVAAGICGSNGALKPAGTPCRPAVGPCDLAETCDGVNVDCPADKLAAAGKECRAAAGACDIAEKCDGAGAECPTDGFKQPGTVCRESAGLCDYAETCLGTSADCPSDSLKPSSTVCRATTNTCDPVENCTGLGAACPADVPPYAQPAAPATLTATPGELQATLTWSAVTGATGYNIKRRTASEPYATIASNVPTTSYVDQGLDSSKTYYYEVSAVNTIAACVSAGNSPEASAKPTGVCSKPATPQATATAGNGQVTLTWAAVSGATAYAVDRSDIGTTGYASLAQIPAPTTTYVDSAVVFGKTYYYRVTAKAACDSDASAEVSAAPLCSPPATAPTALGATAPNTGSMVVLTWTAVAGAKTTDRYYIMRKLASAASYTKIDEVAPPTTTYNDATAVNATVYNYAVTYFNGTCTSGNSNVVTATAACVMDKPVLTLKPGNNKIDLSWTAPANGSLSGFRVYRKDTGNYALVTSLTGAGSTSYADSGLTNGTTYTYYVTAVGNCSADSDAKSSAPVCTPLSAPVNLQASAGDGTVTLTWDAVPGADHYTVSRGSATGGPYTPLTPASPIKTNSYSDTGLTNGQTYYYVVTVSNGSCDSVSSSQASAMPQTCPSQGPPGKPTLSITKSTQVKVDWTAATPAPTGGYNILRATSAPGPYTSVGTVGSAIVTFTDPTDATVGTTYYYQVKAIGDICSNTSAASSIALACSTLAQPTASFTANADGSIKVSWNAVDGATAYTVSRSTINGSGYQPIAAATNITTLSFTDTAQTGLVNATQYYYVVTASSAKQQCVSLQSGQLSVRSCIIPAAPTDVVARRSGHKQVTVVWTNSEDGKLYTVLRNNAPVTTASGSPGVDNTATNTSSFTYTVTAASDANCPASPPSTPQAPVPSCYVMGSGEGQKQLSNVTTEWCVISCNDVSGPGGWASGYACGSRNFYFNGAPKPCETSIGSPAMSNGGYAYYFTAASDGGWVGAQWGNAKTAAACPQ